MKRIGTLFVVLALCALCAVPASALEYVIDAPEDYLFGAPTSDNTIYETKNPNVDRSKDVSLIPPVLWKPVCYLPGNGKYPVMDTIGYTEVTDDLYYADGSLGILEIPSIGLTVKVVEGTDSAVLAKGAGHFTGTSIWDGNCCIAGHNRGTNCYFGNIPTLTAGDTVTLTTKLGTRTYYVTSVQKVSETDSSGTAATSGNQLTLYTCVRNESAYRWCVVAREV